MGDIFESILLRESPMSQCVFYISDSECLVMHRGVVYHPTTLDINSLLDEDGEMEMSPAPIFHRAERVQH